MNLKRISLEILSANIMPAIIMAGMLLLTTWLVFMLIVEPSPGGLEGLGAILAFFVIFIVLLILSLIFYYFLTIKVARMIRANLKMVRKISLIIIFIIIIDALIFYISTFREIDMPNITLTGNIMEMFFAGAL